VDVADHAQARCWRLEDFSSSIGSPWDATKHEAAVQVAKAELGDRLAQLDQDVTPQQQRAAADRRTIASAANRAAQWVVQHASGSRHAAFGTRPVRAPSRGLRRRDLLPSGILLDMHGRIRHDMLGPSS
jgi:hypothetical protein